MYAPVQEAMRTVGIDVHKVQLRIEFTLGPAPVKGALRCACAGPIKKTLLLQIHNKLQARVTIRAASTAAPPAGTSRSNTNQAAMPAALQAVTPAAIPAAKQEDWVTLGQNACNSQ